MGMTANDELLPCPYPLSVYLCHPHIQHSFSGQLVVITGLFTTIKPSGGECYEYTRAQPYTHAQVMALVEAANKVANGLKDWPEDKNRWSNIGEELFSNIVALGSVITPFTQQKEQPNE